MKNHTLFFKKSVVLSTLLFTLMSGFTSQAATVRTPQPSGTTTYGSDRAIIDASHLSDGYVMIKYKGTNPKIKVRISKNTEYTYDLNASGVYETFPFTEGSGTYTVRIFENVSGNSYAQVVTQALSVNLSSPEAPFLYPNQFCNYNSSSAVVSLSDTVTSGIADPLKKVEAVYNYAVDNVAYDYAKAGSVQSGYLPVIDATIAQKKGICFDYAALMTSMLRLQNIPTKLVIGYAGSTYHAWVSVFIQGQGWIDNLIYFNGADWQYVDPTFASTSNRDQTAMSAVAYDAKFTY